MSNRKGHVDFSALFHYFTNGTGTAEILILYFINEDVKRNREILVLVAEQSQKQHINDLIVVIEIDTLRMNNDDGLGAC